MLAEICVSVGMVVWGWFLFFPGGNLPLLVLGDLTLASQLEQLGLWAFLHRDM